MTRSRTPSRPGIAPLAGAALALALAGAARGEDLAFPGVTGLLATPTADVQPQGTAAFGFAHHAPRARGARTQQDENYSVMVGFLPGLEVGGRIVDSREGGMGLRDLSFNGKFRLGLPGGLGLAVGSQDIGGEAQNFRGTYAVATLPWRWLNLSAGYGVGPHTLDGAFGGIELRPSPYLGLMAEHDAHDFNGGLRLGTGDWLAGVLGVPGLRLSATAAYRGLVNEMEYGAHVSLALGRTAPRVATAATAAVEPAGAVAAMPAVPAEAPEPPRPGAGATAPPADAAESAARPRIETLLPTQDGLRAALAALGFEAVRVGLRPPATQVVLLENRRYNHSAADGVGLALGAIATHVDPAIERIELTLLAWGVPQVMVAVPAALYRDFLLDPVAHAPALAAALSVRQVNNVADADQVRHDGAPPLSPIGPELVVEPALRTFLATEYGLVDYSLAARLRLSAPLAQGLMFHLGGAVPLAESDDFGSGRNFETVGVESGLELAALQLVHKTTPRWLWAWTLGRMQVFQADINVLGLEQAWQSDSGAHQLRARLLSLAGGGGRGVALAGYTWYDAQRDYSVALTGGRFYAGDSGLRVELNRWFDDTQFGLFFKAASRDDQAVGLLLTLPLTPRRDMAPGALQVKGTRRWSYTLSTTVNTADGRNPLRPVLLHEPPFEVDLRRDFLDSGRLGEDYLRDELPRLHEAWRLWGQP